MRVLGTLVALVVGFGTSTAAGAAAPHSGIAGRVVAGPTCPVETVPPQPGCAPRPLAVTLQIHLLASRRPAALVHSGIDGRFRIDLPPGTYVVQARRRGHSPLPRPPAPFEVVVRAGRFRHIMVTYDTGIR